MLWQGTFAIHDFKVKVVMTGDPTRLSGDALVNYLISSGQDTIWSLKNCTRNYPRPELISLISQFGDDQADWLVDAMLGTGARGELRAPIDRVTELANNLPIKRLAIDIPSGLDCDAGTPGNPTFKADLTLTLVAMKAGFLNSESVEYLGTTEVIDIGIPLEVLNRAQAVD